MAMTPVDDEVQPNRPAINPATALTPEEIDRLTDGIIAALKTVYDPEIPADIYELGLIYRVDINDERHVNIDMTLDPPWDQSRMSDEARVALDMW
jgi:metal-sulfur cluster biosynthetic enzyme